METQTERSVPEAEIDTQRNSMEGLAACFIENLREKGKTSNTIDAYRRGLEILSKHFSERVTRIEDISTEDIVWAIDQEKELGKEPGTLAQYTTVARMFFKFLAEEGFLTNNPAEDIPPVKRQSVKILKPSITDADLHAFLNASSVRKNEDFRDRTIFELVLDVALTVSELMDLKLVQLNLEESLIHLPHRLVKELKLGAVSREWLKEYIDFHRPELLLERESEFVFVSKRDGRMTRQALWYRPTVWAKKVDLCPKNFNLQSLRKICGVQKRLRGVKLEEIHKIFGYSDFSSTVERFGSIRPIHKSAPTVDRFPPGFNDSLESRYPYHPQRAMPRTRHGQV